MQERLQTRKGPWLPEEIHPQPAWSDTMIKLQSKMGLVEEPFPIVSPSLIKHFPNLFWKGLAKWGIKKKKLIWAVDFIGDVDWSINTAKHMNEFFQEYLEFGAESTRNGNQFFSADKTAVRIYMPYEIKPVVSSRKFQSHFTGGGFDPAAYLAGMGAIMPAGGGAGGRLPGRFGVLESFLRTVSGGKSLGGLFGLSSTGSGAEAGGSPLEEFVDSMEQSGRRYDSILAGMVTRTAEAFGSMGESGGSFVSGLFNSLAGYVMKLAMTTSAASKAFGALQGMNPFAAAAAAVGLFSIGRLLQREGGGGSAGAGSTTAGAGAGAGAYGASGSTIGGPRVLNIYIDGVRGGSYASVDRTLGRAGVDRELRQRIRELVRTGANPVAA